MPYTKLVWEDRRVEFPDKFKSTSNPDGTISLDPRPGIVESEGTPITAGHMNRMEQGIFDAQWQGDTPIAGVVTSLHNGASGNLEQVDESLGGVLRRRTELNRINGALADVTVTIYDIDGATVLRKWKDTLNRTGGAIQGVTREVLA